MKTIQLPPHIKPVYAGYRSTLLPGYQLPSDVEKDFPTYLRPLIIEAAILTETPTHTEVPNHFDECFWLHRVKKIIYNEDFMTGVSLVFANLDKGGEAAVRVTPCDALPDMVLLISSVADVKLSDGYMRIKNYKGFKIKFKSEIAVYLRYYWDCPRDVCFFAATPEYLKFSEHLLSEYLRSQKSVQHGGSKPTQDTQQPKHHTSSAVTIVKQN